MATVTPNALPVDIDRTTNARPKPEPVRSDDAPSFEHHLDRQTETAPTASAEQPASPKPVAPLESDQSAEVATPAPKTATPAPSVPVEGELLVDNAAAIETGPSPDADPALAVVAPVVPEALPSASEPAVAATPLPQADEAEPQPAPQFPASIQSVEGLKPDAIAEIPAPNATQVKPADPSAETKVETVTVQTQPVEPGGNPAPVPQQSVAYLLKPDAAVESEVDPQPPLQEATDGEPVAGPAPAPVEAETNVTPPKTTAPIAPAPGGDVLQTQQTGQPADATAVLPSDTDLPVEAPPAATPVDIALSEIVDEGTTPEPFPSLDSLPGQAATAATPALPHTGPAPVTQAPEVQPQPASTQPAQPAATPVATDIPTAAVPETPAEPAAPAIVAAPEAAAPEAPVDPAKTLTLQGEQPAAAPAAKPEAIAEDNPERPAQAAPQTVAQRPGPEIPAPQPVPSRPAGGLLAQNTGPEARTAPVAPQTPAGSAPDTTANTLSTFDQAVKAASNGSPERTFAPPSTTIAPNAPVADPAAPLPTTTIAPAGDPVTSTLPLAQNSHDVSIRIAMPTQPGANVQTPVNTLAFNIAKNFDNGVTRFQVRIDPPELGRVDVKMDMTVEGRVQAHLTVERAETLELMMRDARSLEKALADTGLNLGRDSLTFSLKDGNGFSAQDQAGDGAWDGQDAQDDTDDQQPQEMTRGYISDTGVDISV